MIERNLTKQQKEYIIKLLQEGKELPEEFKYLLFPTKQKEYELVYAGKIRKEDLLANADGVFPVPLQINKVFNGDEHEAFEDGWKNMIVFGDNLQFLKTVYENKDPLIKDKVKGKVKLIYIDPPFGTGDEYDGNKGQSAYSAKRKGAEFIEFLRRRLILAKEILANNGSIFLRLDYHFGHYIKVIMDEVFGKENFRNEIVVKRTRTLKGEHKQFATATDTIFFYAKNKDFLNFYGYRKLKPKKEWKWVDMHLPGSRKDESLLYRNIFEKKVKAPEGRRWALSQEGFDDAIAQGLVRWNEEKQMPEFLTKWETIGSNWTDIPGYSKKYDYPTENSEELLERIIKSVTKERDLVLDFFSGSGTTAAVAEKLGRRWIVCDIGKYSYYTMQKRILTIQSSKDLENPKKKYGKKAKSFITARLGLYDLKQALDMEWERYLNFVSQLFEVDINSFEIAGFKFDGKKGEYPVKVFDYKKFKDSSVDEDYLKEIHNVIGKRVSGRVYIIAPANYIDFLTDYYEIDGLRYYFLKIPYQVIKELHKIPFQKLRQPQSKKNVNDLEEVIGFHFIRQPEVKTELRYSKTNDLLREDTFEIVIKEFRSQYYKDEEGKILENFETISAVFIDKDYNGKYFEMDEVYFADELLPKKSKKKESDEDIREELKEIKDKGLVISLKKSEVGKQIMIVYTDIYGNDFTEIFDIK